MMLEGGPAVIRQLREIPMDHEGTDITCIIPKQQVKEIATLIHQHAHTV
jgi:hypothetical protein